MSKRKLRRRDVADRRSNLGGPGQRTGRLRWLRIRDLRKIDR